MKASLSILGAIAILMQIFPALAETQVLHVVPAGTSGNTPQSPYATAETAANSISDALNAVSGDQPAVINVAPGVYAVDEEIKITKPNVTIQSRDAEGKLAREKTFIDGGYPERFPKSVSNRLFKVSANNVTFKGLTLQNTLYHAAGTDTDGGGAAYIGAAGFVLDSCTLTNCCVAYGYGGAIVFYQRISEDNSHLITNSTFHSCRTSRYGGAVSRTTSPSQIGDGMVDVIKCVFIDNMSIREGALAGDTKGSRWGGHFGNLPVNVKDSTISGGTGNSLIAANQNCSFENCIFENMLDITFSQGQGSFLVNNSIFRSSYLVSLKNMEFNCCVFSNITYSGQYGNAPLKVFEGGTVKNSLWIHNLQPIVAKSTTFENCSIVSNYVGGIVMSESGETATFKNCVIAGNKNYYQNIGVSSSGGASINYRNGWKNGAASSLTLRNCYIEGADKISVDQYKGTGVDVTVYPSGSTVPILAFDTTGASDRIFESAKEKGPGFADAENGDWHLARKSPLRDAGINADWMANATDLEGKPRLLRLNGKYSASATVDLGCYECDLPVSEGLRLFLR